MSLRLKHVQQLDRTGCGPACVAIIAGVSYDTAKTTMFGDARGPFWSEYPDLRSALRSLDISVAMRAVYSTSFAQSKQLSIFRCKKSATTGNSHFVVYDRATGHLYDPQRPEPLQASPKLDARYRPLSRLEVRSRGD